MGIRRASDRCGHQVRLSARAIVAVDESARVPTAMEPTRRCLARECAWFIRIDTARMASDDRLGQFCRLSKTERGDCWPKSGHSLDPESTVTAVIPGRSPSNTFCRSDTILERCSIHVRFSTRHGRTRSSINRSNRAMSTEHSVAVGNAGTGHPGLNILPRGSKVRWCLRLAIL